MTTPVDKPEAATICVSPLATRPLFYTDTLHGKQTCRDDLWAVTTEELNRLQHALTARDEALRGCVEHMEWSTMRGRAAHDAARAILAKGETK